MAFSVQEAFSQETYGRTSLSSVVAAAVGGFHFLSPSFSFVRLFVFFSGDWRLHSCEFSKNDSRST